MGNYVTIIGVKKGQYKGRDGVMKNSFNYYGVKDFNARDLETSDCEGQVVVQEWSGVDFSVHPGDVVRFIYEPGYQDKATLVDVELVSHGDGNPFTGKEADASAAPAPDKAADGKDKNKAGA